MIATDSVGPARPVVAAYDDPADALLGRLAGGRVAPIRRDCEGHFRPGLARAWSADTSGAAWTLELDPAPSAPGDTSPRWTAATLAAAWRADPDADAALRSAGMASLVPLDERRLVVGFVAAWRTVPPVFANRALGVARPGPAGVLEAEPAGGDLHDAVDRGPDLIVTGDPDLLDYAARRPGMTSVALPWNRTYFLVVPSGSAGVGAAVSADTAAFRAALARDAVRIDARPAAPAWSDSAARCLRPGGDTPVPAPASSFVAFPGEDRTARELTERIVALARPMQLSVRPLDADSLRLSLDRGGARAFIVPGPPAPAGRCEGAEAWPAGATVIPLIETRPHAIVRRGAPLLAVEWDGAVRPAEPADTAGSAP